MVHADRLTWNGQDVLFCEKFCKLVFVGTSEHDYEKVVHMKCCGEGMIVVSPSFIINSICYCMNSFESSTIIMLEIPKFEEQNLKQKLDESYISARLSQCDISKAVAEVKSNILYSKDYLN